MLYESFFMFTLNNIKNDTFELGYKLFLLNISDGTQKLDFSMTIHKELSWNHSGRQFIIFVPKYLFSMRK